MRRIAVTLALVPFLASCAYVTAKPAPLGSAVEGIPFYGVRNYVIVRGTEVVSLSLPDCSQRYALQVGSFLAKNKTTVTFSNGVIAKLETDQDSTAAIVPLFDFAKSVISPAKPAGNAMSTETGGSESTNFGLFEVKCDGAELSLIPAISKDQLMTVVPGSKPPATPASAPTNAPEEDEDGEAAPPAK